MLLLISAREVSGLFERIDQQQLEFNGIATLAIPLFQ